MNNTARNWPQLLKRAIDIGAVILGLLLLWPVLLCLALLIAWRSGTPVLHREQRIGRHGHPFTLLKFRTLLPGGAPQSSIAPEDDHRITPVGLPLRRTRLDELPQLYNVLVGDMSLVGPRPMVPSHVEALDKEVRATLLSVQPGVTDPASVLFFAEDAVLAGRSDAEQEYLQILLPAKAEVQLDYLRHWSPWLDIVIIFKTLARVWSAQARQESMARVQAILQSGQANPAPPPQRP